MQCVHVCISVLYVFVCIGICEVYDEVYDRFSRHEMSAYCALIS